MSLGTKLSMTMLLRLDVPFQVYFKCNGVKTHALNFEFVDPHTGVRIIEGEYNVTRELVDEYFGNDKFQCSCFAWTSRGQIRSQVAFIEIACKWSFIIRFQLVICILIPILMLR